jgi:Ca2+-transporting ATPase
MSETLRPPPGEVGLDHAEAARRLARDGPNDLVPETRARTVRRLLQPLLDPMVLLLLVAAPTYLALGDRREAVVSVVAVAPIAAIGWLLESRATHALDALRRASAPVAHVWRDDRLEVLAAGSIVQGDLIEVREGDLVVADATVVATPQLLVDESSLTGESVPVALSPGDEVLAGATVVSGRATARVRATGPRTRFGRIGSLLASVHPRATPLQRTLRRLLVVIGSAAAVACLLVVGVELVRGRGWGAAIIAGVSLGIAAVPEEFSVVYTLYLSLGAWRLSRDHALVRNLPAVETLGSTTVICTDKTGTLTSGGLHVVDAVPATGRDVVSLLTWAVLASEPNPYDPLDVAIVELARERGVDVDRLHRDHLVADWPFDPATRHVTHVWRSTTGCRVAAKGAIEGTPGVVDALAAAHAALTARGLRVVAVTGAELTEPTGTREGDEADLRPIGLLAFSDPLRPGVLEALAECGAAGIRVVVVTGDHPATAHAVVEALGLPHADPDGHDRISTGDDIDAAVVAGTLAELVATTNVFARTRPEQKDQLVAALQDAGEVVAMTGDGVNDAPALRRADIGVAMGQRGTAVAREAAALVLLDDSFATIVRAVRDGRRIFDNLARAFAYLIAFHPPLLIAALFVPLLGRPLLLLPIHLVALELLLHPAVSLVFEADPPAADTMRRPPRPVGTGLTTSALLRPLLSGLTLGAAVVAGYLVALHRGWPTGEARAFGFVTLVLGQTWQLVAERVPDRPVWHGLHPTRVLVVVVAAMTAVAVGSVVVPPLATLLELAPMSAAGWAAAVALATVSSLAWEPTKRGSTEAAVAT